MYEWLGFALWMKVLPQDWKVSLFKDVLIIKRCVLRSKVEEDAQTYVQISDLLFRRDSFFNCLNNTQAKPFPAAERLI